jgi:hypothetical protein
MMLLVQTKAGEIGTIKGMVNNAYDVIVGDSIISVPPDQLNFIAYAPDNTPVPKLIAAYRAARETLPGFKGSFIFP